MAGARDLARTPIKPPSPKGPKGLQPPHEPAPARRRLSFHEKHALETLPKSIAALQAKLRELHQRLDDPSLYARRRQAFDETSAALTAAQTELAAAEEKWLELEVLREEIEGDSY